MNLSSPKCRDIWKFFLLVICVHLGRQSSAQVTSGLSGRTENVDEAIDFSNVGPNVVENEVRLLIDSVIPTVQLIPTMSPSNAPPTMKPSEHPTIVIIRESPYSITPILTEVRETKLPSQVPSREATNSPTRLPSKKPTRKPTEKPTRKPTEKPTRKPTEKPTRKPSTKPSRSPSHRPTRHPSPKPSRTPSRSPSSKPSRNPSSSPSRKPSSKPSRRPINFPTVSPASSGTADPSRAPSASPTMKPTKSSTPSVAPSESPTYDPSYTPSVTPTNFPTVSMKPSSLPSIRPTNHPTITAAPTITHEPSISPSLSNMPSIGLTSERIRGIKMNFRNLEPLNSTSISVWEDVTERHIYTYLNDITVLETIEEVDVVYISDKELTEAKLLRSFAKGNRYLQDDVLEINCDIIVRFRTSADSFNINLAISDAFRTSNSKFLYLSELQEASPDMFGLTEFLSISVPDRVENANDDLDDIMEDDAFQGSKDNISFTGIIIGSSIGILVIALIGTFVYIKKVKRDSLTGSHMLEVLDNNSEAPVNDDDEASVEDAVVARILDVQAHDDDTISALEDPTVFQVGMSSKSFDDGDETWTIAQNTVGGESILPSGTDLARVYGSSSISVASKADATQDSIPFSKGIGADSSASGYDANDALERIEIVAPSGKLGIVIDTPGPNMPPIIHAIKDSSVLSSQLQIGDRIVEFNGEDTSNLTAIMLTKRISSTFDMEERKFVIHRAKPSEEDEKMSVASSVESSLF